MVGKFWHLHCAANSSPLGQKDAFYGTTTPVIEKSLSLGQRQCKCGTILVAISLAIENLKMWNVKDHTAQSNAGLWAHMQASENYYFLRGST